MRPIPRPDSQAGWRNLLFGLTGFTILIYLVRAFATPFTIQDDARQFMAWMPRLTDPDLLRGDLIGDYWQSVSPPLYRLPFEFLALLGVDPLLFARLLPVLLIALAAGAAWRIGMHLTQRPLAAFVAAAAVMALVIHEDSIFTASPRAFSPPLFLLFVDALLKQRGKTMVAILFLLASIYPTTALVGFSMLALSRIGLAPLRIDLSRRSLLLIAAAAGAIVVAIVPFPTQTSRWEPTLTLSQAMEMPNLNQAEGRSGIVREDGRIGWICSARMGFVPEMVPCGRGIPGAELINILLLLPLLWLAYDGVRRPDGSGHNPNILYAWALLAAAAWYAVAVLFAFKLHLPSRYSQRVLSILEWLAIGQLLGLWLQARMSAGRRGWWLGGAGILGVLFLISFATPTPGLRQPSDPRAMALIAALPPGAMVAGISEDMDFVPALTGRAALATTEHAIPYHIGYFGHIGERLGDMLLAAATPDQAELARFVERYEVDMFAIEPALLEGRLPPRYTSVVPDAARHAEAMLAARASVLQRLARPCAVHRGALILLDARCLAGAAEPPRRRAGE